MDEVARVSKFSVDGSETDVGDFIERSQPLDDPFSNGARRNLLAVSLNKIGDHAVNEIFDRLEADRTLFASFLYAQDRLLAIEVLEAAVAFLHPQGEALNLLVGGEASPALEAFSTSADGRPILQRP